MSNIKIISIMSNIIILSRCTCVKEEYNANINKFYHCYYKELKSAIVCSTPKVQKLITASTETLMKFVKGAPIQWDLSLNFLFNYKTTLGIANRLDSALCFLAGFQLSDSFFIGFGYDYMVNE